MEFKETARIGGKGDSFTILQLDGALTSASASCDPLR